jgi:hypothetical protein
VGTNGQVLVPNSACAAGVEWVTRSALSICGYTCTATPFNTAIGANAGDSITSAVNNTAVGYNAGTANATGNNNTFVGFAAGDATTSDNNTALGSNALGGGGVNNNTAVGYNSGCSLTTGGSNTFVGAAAGDNTTTADNVVAVGYNALGAAHTANGTVAIGANTLAANTSGAGNTAVGFNSGVAITTGSNNTVLGFNAGDTISTGTQNTFLGACSGGSLAGTSEGNTGIGFSALGQGITSGAYNTVVGNSAGLAVTSGALNTLIGYTAGQAITTGGSNTLVGRYIGTSALSNNVVLSDGAGTIRFQSNASGAISLGAGGAYGTAGQVLVSQGSSAAPTWVNNTPDGVAGVTGTAPITVNNTDPANPIIGASAASTSAAGVVQLNDTVTSTSTTQAATANAVKAAYDAAVAAQGTANAALPKAGGTMTGNIVFSDAGEGVIFSDASSISGISDSVVTSSSIVAASSTAVKAAYDAALAAQAASPLTSATVLYVNVTTGNNSTGARGTAKPFATLTAALAAASTGDTIFVAPGTYVESPTLSKGVNIIGTFTDQTIGNGPKISGTFTVNITGAGTRNWAVANMIFQASSVGNNSVVVSNNSFAVGGIGCFDNCFFQQFTSASITEQCFATSGTWTRSLYLRSCTFDGNFTHNAGTTAGANGYVVIDNLLGIAGSDKYYKVMTGTCEFRSPSNALAPVLHTGGTLIASNVLGWISNVAATTSIFGGTGFAYKGTSAGLGQATVSLAGQGVNVVEGSTWGKVSVGANVIYAFGNVNYDTSLATLAGVPLYSVLPNPNGVLSTMSRPQWGYLTTPSSVTAANQLGVILDSTNGNVYTTSAFDAGTF